jgi:pimeloyl-ACP methyl ester carboxylesterase
MIFAHGYGCDQNMWRLLTPAFRGRYRIILFDLVGSGVATAHGGTVSVTSSKEAGTTFTFRAESESGRAIANPRNSTPG